MKYFLIFKRDGIKSFVLHNTLNINFFNIKKELRKCEAPLKLIAILHCLKQPDYKSSATVVVSVEVSSTVVVSVEVSSTVVSSVVASVVVVVID